MRIPSNKVADIIRFIDDELRLLHNARAISIIATELLDLYADLGRVSVLANKEQTVNESVLLEISRAVKKLKAGMPLEYATGRAFFYGEKFNVSPDVLIPRPETEELVKHVLETVKDLKAPTILDACTGSGCIAIALKKNIIEAKMYAFDKSPGALEIAKLNAEHLQTKVHFFEEDLLNFSHDRPLPLFDVLVSNPPYVRMCEKTVMKDNVLNYEPHAALFVEDSQPLIFYEALAKLGHNILKPGAVLCCEINEALGTETALIFEQADFTNIEIVKDLNGKDRIVKGKRK